MICKTINANAKAKEIHVEHPLINQFPPPCLLRHAFFPSLELCRPVISSQTTACNNFIGKEHKEYSAR